MHCLAGLSPAYTSCTLCIVSARRCLQIPKDAKIIVACQKGLRSLAAAEQLSRAGYMDLAWVNGGLDNSTPGDVPTRDDKDVRYAGIGGVSEMVGWTEVQQENAGPAGSLKSVFIAVRWPSPPGTHIMPC